MKKSTDRKAAGEPFDSWDYCINFWEGAIDNDEDTDRALQELDTPRHIRAYDDVA